MAKELPDWLKSSGEVIRRQTPLSTSEIQEKAKDEKWNNLSEEIMPYIDKWNSLEVNRIFNDVAGHIFKKSYTFPPTEKDTEHSAFPAELYLKDNLGNFKSIGACRGRYDLKPPEALSTLKYELKQLGQSGIQPSNISFGKLTADFFYGESRGNSEDGTWVDYIYTHKLTMDNLTLSLSTTNGAKIFTSNISELNNVEDLERLVDKFAAETLIKQQKETEIMRDKSQRKGKLDNFVSNLQLNQFLHLGFNKISKFYPNIDNISPDELTIPNSIYSFIGDKDSIIIKVISNSASIGRDKKTKKDMKADFYSLIAITLEGKIIIPQEDTRPVYFDVKDVKPG